MYTHAYKYRDSIWNQTIKYQYVVIEGIFILHLSNDERTNNITMIKSPLTKEAENTEDEEHDYVLHIGNL